MRPERAAVILTAGDRVATIRRERAGRTYYLLPGGTVEPDETSTEAARREIHEELGLEVTVGRLLAVVAFESDEGRSIQRYYDGTITGGVFGTGDGPELGSDPASSAGGFTPHWLPMADIGKVDCRPSELFEEIRHFGITRMLTDPLDITEQA